MNKKIEGVIFLILTAVVTLICVLLTIFWYFDQLPDPINIIAILTFSFGPSTIMFLCFFLRYKD